jgi:hypothetical protein
VTAEDQTTILRLLAERRDDATAPLDASSGNLTLSLAVREAPGRDAPRRTFH